jgi:hypothetical protein
MIGKKTSLAVVLLLGIAAMSAILHLQAGATASKNAQLTLADIRTELNALQSAPFHASAKTGGSRVLARREMDTEMSAFMRELGTLRRDAPPKPLERIGGPLGANYRRSRRSTAAAHGEAGTAPRPTGWRPTRAAAPGASSGCSRPRTAPTQPAPPARRRR